MGKVTSHINSSEMLSSIDLINQSRVVNADIASLTLQLAAKASQSSLDTTNESVTANTLSLSNMVSKGSLVVSVKDYGAKGDGVTDDTTAILNAILHFGSNDGIIFFPSGTYNFSQQLNLNKVKIYGSGMATTILKCTAKLGTGIPAINTLTNTTTPLEVPLCNFQLKGPGGWTLGTKNANVDGISINSQYTIRDVLINGGFDNGIVMNSPGGHITLENVKSGGNYFNIYWLQDNGDNTLICCDFTGAMMASIGVPYNKGISGGGDTFYRTHLGFAPYGIYQEVGAVMNGPFMQSCLFDQTHFENIGNAAIFTEQWQTAYNTVNNGFAYMKLYEVGFSWGTTYYLSSKTKDNAIKIPYANGQNYYSPGMAPFYGYNGATPFYIGVNYGWWYGNFQYQDFTMGGYYSLYPESQNAIPVNGSTAGKAYLTMMTEHGTSGVSWNRPFKKIIIELAGYENSTGIADTITFPAPLFIIPYKLTDTTSIPGLTITKTNITLNPNNTTIYNGVIVLEGY
jgi:hypothetical protein